MSNRILVNEIGYLPGQKKRGVFTGEKSCSFQVVRKNHDTEEVMLTAESGQPIFDKDGGEFCSVIDFTEITIPGTYVIRCDSAESVPFMIGEDVYRNLEKDITRFYYLQRCGQELSEQIAGKFAHKSCHDTPARVYGTDKFLEVNGGWHDAGDYGRYIVAAAVTLAALFYGIQEKPEFAGLNPDLASGPMPDLLQEIRYELEWMLKMQEKETGKVYHKVSCAGFCGFIMPEEEREELVICPPSLTATADFAACMAMAVAFYKPYDEAFAKQLEDAARKAYDVMKEIQVPGGFMNPEGVVTGSYEDKIEKDELYWAAAELYKAFGDRKYRDDFESYVNQEVLHGYGWEDVGSFGNLAYLSAEFDTDEELRNKIKASMVAFANEKLEKANKSGFGVAFDENEYIWGSNMYAAENGSHLYGAYVLTGDEKYLDAAREQVHYILGKNACGKCFVTGHGTNRIYNPHHRPSSVIKEAMPGMVIGGPDSGLHDPDAIADCTGMPPAKCYTDKLLSYSTNEITIYWNSALIMLMAQVMK